VGPWRAGGSGAIIGDATLLLTPKPAALCRDPLRPNVPSLRAPALPVPGGLRFAVWGPVRWCFVLGLAALLARFGACLTYPVLHITWDR
jgi:hypothetical protein